MSVPAPLALSALSAPLTALRLLATEHADLPAGQIRLSDLFPEQLDVSLHDDLGAFETWRAALGIAPDLVTCGVQSSTRTRVLKAVIDYAGARLCLTGYSPVLQQDRGAK